MLHGRLPVHTLFASRGLWVVIVGPFVPRKFPARVHTSMAVRVWTRGSSEISTIDHLLAIRKSLAPTCEG